MPPLIQPNEARRDYRVVIEFEAIPIPQSREEDFINDWDYFEPSEKFAVSTIVKADLNACKGKLWQNEPVIVFSRSGVHFRTDYTTFCESIIQVTE